MLESLIQTAYRRRVAVLVASAVVVAVSVILASRITFDANILRLLPQHGTAVQRFQVFLSEFGSLDYLYILFEAPERIDDHTELVDAYADELRKLPEIVSVDAQPFEAGKDWGYLFDHELLLLGPNGVDEALQ